MKQHLNTLFIQTQGAYLQKEGQAVAVRIEKKVVLRVPMHQLDSLVLLGRIGASPYLLGACGQAGVRVSMLTEHGRFLAAVQGFSSGNVLLRRQQYRAADDQAQSLAIARPIIAAKIANMRTVLLRASRDRKQDELATLAKATAERMAGDATAAMNAATLDGLRGIEGESSASYFRAFNALITSEDEGFVFTARSRRPPLDPLNALLSFLYTLLAHDYRSACEAAGLDAAVGFLHRDRPGRPSLALDLMEALRPVLADRLAVSLINRRQVKSASFVKHESGAVTMDDKTRKTILVAWQERKKDELLHPVLNEKISLGLLPHIQARLLARHLRGDHDLYPEFIWR